MTDAAHGRRWRGLHLATLLVVVVVLAFAGGWFFGSRGDATPGAGSVDVGFLQDMADHHDQAVQLALIELSNGEAEVLQGFATDVIASQRHEIGLMEARLADWGHHRGDVNRRAMAWMSMSTKPAQMPGMASAADVAAFAAAKGRDADAAFIRLMTAHHEGGIHMAEDAWKHGETKAVRELAERIAKLQRVEVRDLQRFREQLGLPA